MSFLSWHYTHGVSFYVKRFIFQIKKIEHYFSVKLLFFTLFAPWKRLVNTENQPGFNLSRSLEKATFNILSRCIGAVVRSLLIVVALLTILFVLIGGALFFVLWIFVPLFSFPIYQKFQRHPKIVVEDLIKKLKYKHPAQVLGESVPGHFMFKHLGFAPKEMVNNAQAVNISEESLRISTFRQFMEILLQNNLWTEEYLRSINLKREDILAAAAWWDKLAIEESYINEDPKLGRPGIGLELLYGFTPTLNDYVTDLGVPNNFSHHLIGRQTVVNRIERNLANGQNIILTGQPGVGKHTVLLEFANRATQGLLGQKLAYQRVLELDYSSLLAGSEDIAQKKKLLSDILTEASSAGNVILVIRDLHRLTDSEIEGVDLTDVLESHIQKGELKVISTVSNVEYERFVSRNMRLRKYFEVIVVQQPNMSEAFEILMDAATQWEYKTNLIVTVPALRMILTGSDKYISEAPFPEKALELLDAVVAYKQSQPKSDGIINIADVQTIIAEKTGVSFNNLTDERRTQLSNLENVIHERLINQNTAVNMIAKILRSKVVGVVNNDRPLGSFLFFGPTGVGKTETAKVLAKVYFGSPEKIIRFNMAEYAGREGLERLIGSVEHNMPGVLTTAIKDNPSSLLLLDEIEKAPAGIHNLLLSLLDEGEITDAFDRTIKASNLFVIATSNAGAEQVRQLVQQGIDGEELQKSIVDYVMQEQTFSPELINRFDGVVVYQPLSKEHLLGVARLLTKEVVNNLKEKNINIVFSDEAIQKIVDEGYDPSFGARPMRRLVEVEIGDMIGRAILDKNIAPGLEVRIIPQEGEQKFTISH